MPQEKNGIERTSNACDRVIAGREKGHTKRAHFKPVQIQGVPTGFEQFNELVGLPQHPATLKQMGMMPWQIEFFDTVNRPQPIKVHINKARQIGFTENMQRYFAYQGFFKYTGRKIINIAGTREKTAKKIQTRLRALFNNIENTIADNGTDLWFKLKNGTEYEAVPSNSSAVRGDTKIAAFGVDEAAHFELIDDSVVIDSIIPLADTNHSDVFAFSTPNGRRGFFYKLSITENDFLKLQYNIYKVQGYLHSPDEIKKMLSRTDIDVDQEYLCQFTATHSTTFTEEMIRSLRDDKKAIDLSKMFEHKET